MEFTSHSGRVTFQVIAIVAFSLWTLFASLNGRDDLNTEIRALDSLYTGLVFKGREAIPSSKWTKSVLFNPAGTSLYTFNLEEMSIYEFESSTRKLTRKFRFEANAAPGWDYDLNKPIPSFEEKPVEGCFSHDGKILWVSLHNAGGIVSIPMDSNGGIDIADKMYRSHSYPTKCIYIYNTDDESEDTVVIPLIKTGKTPKIITVSADSRYLLVSNWHSSTVSVLQIQDSLPPYGNKIKDIRTGTYPRGIAITKSPSNSYVANMSSNIITVINNKTWSIKKQIPTIKNPRHVISDGGGRLFVSYNISSKIACIDAKSGRTLYSSTTSASPRTIALSRNKKFLFVACYEGNTIDVFRIGRTGFNRIYSISCKDKPVGIDLREDSEELEAWVCTYNGGSLQVLSFLKKR